MQVDDNDGGGHKVDSDGVTPPVAVAVSLGGGADRVSSVHVELALSLTGGADNVSVSSHVVVVSGPWVGGTAVAVVSSVQVVSTGAALVAVSSVVQVVSTGDTIVVSSVQVVSTGVTVGAVMPEVQLVEVPGMASTPLVEVPAGPVPVGLPFEMVELKVGNGGGEAGRVPLEDRGWPVSEPGMLVTGLGVLMIEPGVLMMEPDDVESPPLGGDAVDPGLPVPQPLDGPVVPQGTVEFGRG